VVLEKELQNGCGGGVYHLLVIISFYSFLLTIYGTE